MSMEEFNEFRRQLAASVLKLKHDVRRYPLFNTDCSHASTGDQFEENERSRAERWLGRKCHSAELSSSERCCLAVKFRCGWLRCNRKRSQRVLNAHLERLSLLKKLNMAISDEDPHMGICLFHWRMIKYGKPGFVLTSEELNSREASETRLERSERSEDNSDVMLIESSTSSEREESDDDLAAEDRGAGQKGNLNWREIDIKRRKTKSPSAEADEGEEQKDSEEEEERSGLCTLSAASLRRYRKFFMIPTKASASKHAMLEGVESHFERLPVRASDAIVHFIYTAKNRMNTVE